MRKLTTLWQALVAVGLVNAACGLPPPGGGGGGNGTGGAPEGGTPRPCSAPDLAAGERCSTTACSTNDECAAGPSRCTSNLGVYCSARHFEGCEGGSCVYSRTYSSACPDLTPPELCLCHATPTASACAACCETAAHIPSEVLACACGPEGACGTACADSRLCGGSTQTTLECADCLASVTRFGAVCGQAGCNGCLLMRSCLSQCG